MSDALLGKIERLNAQYKANQENEALAAKKRAAEREEQIRRDSVLREDGPAFLLTLKDATTKLVADLNEKILNPAHKLHVTYGTNVRQVVVSAGPKPIANQIRYPCVYVALPDTMDRLVRGIAISKNSIREEVVEWRPKDMKVELLKGDQPVTVEAFSKIMVAKYFDNFA